MRIKSGREVEKDTETSKQTNRDRHTDRPHRKHSDKDRNNGRRKAEKERGITNFRQWAVSLRCFTQLRL